MVLQIMAFLTEQLQVIKTQSNLRVVDVLGRQINLVVHDLTAGAASLTQTVPVGNVCRPGALPGFRLVEPPRPRFHGDHSRRATSPAAGGENRGASGMSLGAPCPKFYFANGNCSCTAAIRWRMISQYSG